MEKYYIVLIVLGLCVSMTRGQAFCEEDVNACTGQFTYQQQLQAESGFNLTAICKIVDDFMSCVDTSLAPCDVITKNTLMSAIDQLINIYTSPPYGCELDFDDDFEYGNCSQEVTECAFFKYDAEEASDNATEACSQFDRFVECMEQNTTSCEGTERGEITQSIQNTTDTFSKCPYACGQPALDCTTTTSTTTPATTTVTTKKPAVTQSAETTTSTPKPTTTKSDTTSVGTTDYATPNYDNGAPLRQQSLVFLVTSLLLAFLA